MGVSCTTTTRSTFLVQKMQITSIRRSQTTRTNISSVKRIPHGHHAKFTTPKSWLHHRKDSLQSKVKTVLGKSYSTVISTHSVLSTSGWKAKLKKKDIGKTSHSTPKQDDGRNLARISNRSRRSCKLRRGFRRQALVWGFGAIQYSEFPAFQKTFAPLLSQPWIKELALRFVRVRPKRSRKNAIGLEPDTAGNQPASSAQ